MNASQPHPRGSLRSLSAEDVPGVRALVAESSGAAQWSAEAYAQLLETQSPARALVLREEQRIVGFIAIRVVAEEAEILNLAVAASHRRKGHGTRLLAAAEEFARSRGASQLFLEVRESNSSAVAFYEARGFARAGLRRNYYQQPPEAAVLMTRKITAVPG